jgi:ferredoxin-NADP reductase
VLRYITFKIAKDKYNFTGNKFFGDNEFSIISDDFKLVYFSSFTEESSSVYHTMCQNLESMDSQYNLGIFKYIVRFSDKNETRWDTEYLSKTLSSYKNQITKALICGPTKFLDDIKKSLIDGLIVDKDKIILV